MSRSLEQIVFQIMKRLSLRRPVFHSEADFQFEFANELRLISGVTDVRLERRLVVDDIVMNLDITARLDGVATAFELKYLRSQLTTLVGGERFDLKASANDLARFESLKDVQRLESLMGRHVAQGVAVILALAPGFWNGSKPNCNDAQFELRQGREVTGLLCWKAGTAKSTTKNGQNIFLNGTYKMDWQPYTQHSEFEGRYLAINIMGSVKH